MIYRLKLDRSPGHRRFLVIAGLLLVGLTASSGCREPLVSKSLPAPIRDEVEYQLVGKIERVWGGDHFEFGDHNELHYILVRGVDCPKYGQKFYSIARREMRNLTKNKQIRIEVVDRDEMMTEIADVFVVSEDPNQADINVALELISTGMGWYDGNEFEGSELLKSAQANAKKDRTGLWSQENPVPPWEYESNVEQSILDKLKLE